MTNWICRPVFRAHNCHKSGRSPAGRDAGSSKARGGGPASKTILSSSAAAAVIAAAEMKQTAQKNIYNLFLCIRFSLIGQGSVLSDLTSRACFPLHGTGTVQKSVVEINIDCPGNRGWLLRNRPWRFLADISRLFRNSRLSSSIWFRFPDKVLPRIVQNGPIFVPLFAGQKNRYSC